MACHWCAYPSRLKLCCFIRGISYRHVLTSPPDLHAPIHPTTTTTLQKSSRMSTAGVPSRWLHPQAPKHRRSRGRKLVPSVWMIHKQVWRTHQDHFRYCILLLSPVLFDQKKIAIAVPWSPGQTFSRWCTPSHSLLKISAYGHGSQFQFHLQPLWCPSQCPSQFPDTALVLPVTGVCSIVS